MKKLNFIYSSFDEFYESFFRGNEVEFKYRGKFYHLLPYLKDNRVVAILFGEFYKDDITVCSSKQELLCLKIEDQMFIDIYSQVDVLWYNI